MLYRIMNALKDYYPEYDAGIKTLTLNKEISVQGLVELKKVLENLEEKIYLNVRS